jgi:hypothetical protein
MTDFASDHRAAMIGFYFRLPGCNDRFASDRRVAMTGLGVWSPGYNDRSEASCRWYVPPYKAIKSHSLRRALHLTFASGYLPA